MGTFSHAASITPAKALLPARMTITPIAHVRSCFPSKFAAPRQPGLCPSAYGTLVFEPEFRMPEALRGIEGFSHLWLVFGFHETAERGWSPTVRPPRLGGNERVGVFATRSTFRPNSLGLSLVALETVEHATPVGCVLHLGGLDLIDGTPVYDIKPYLAYAESQPDACSGFATAEINRLPVIVSPSALPDFMALPERDQRVIREALSLDPRPAAGAGDHSRVFGFPICRHEVKFTVAGGEVCVSAVTPIHTPDESQR